MRLWSRPFPRAQRGYLFPLDESRPLDPNAFAFTRALGPASWQTAPAVDGTTFISYDLALAANTPRFHYVSSAGRRMLLIEPARTNKCRTSIIRDNAPANDIPDNALAEWGVNAGAAGVDFTVADAGGPAGDGYVELLDTAVGSRGLYDANGAGMIPAGTAFCTSCFVRRHSGAGASGLVFGYLNPGITTLAIAGGVQEWSRKYVPGTTVGAATIQFCGMSVNGASPGIFRVSGPQAEVGGTPSTWIPTDGADGTRAVEGCAIDPDLMPVSSGDISMLWAPGFASTDTWALDYHVLLSFDGAAGTTYLTYLSSTKRLFIVNAGFSRAISAALTFSAWDCMSVRIQYGSAGTRLTVNGTATQDSTAWIPFAPTPLLGRHGGYGESSAYGDLRMAA